MSADLPPQWPWLFRGFRKYAVRYARKHFHAVRLSKASAAIAKDGPVLVAMNHPSWWDPILCFVLSREFGSRPHYGAIDARAVEKYQFMKRAGLFPVEMNSLRGAAAFLKTGEAILAKDNVLWITAQGEFADVRKRPLDLRSGVGHLAAKMTRGVVLPIAVEYAYWNESKPEALVRIGEPLPPQTLDGKAWTRLIEERLTQTLDNLAVEAISRDAGKFTSLVSGRVGVGGVYDAWRRSKAWLTGRPFDASHEGPP